MAKEFSNFFLIIIHKIIYCNVAIEKAALLRAVYPL